jgi:hypothetical protein
MSFCCGRSGLPFEVVWERAGPSEKFAVTQVNKTGGAAAVGADAFGIPIRKEFSVDEFSFAGWHCPYCSSRSFVRCPCGQSNCDGRPKRLVGFVELYKCEPGCGREMELVRMEKVDVSQDKRRDAQPAARLSAIARPARPALSKGGTPLLPRTRP